MAHHHEPTAGRLDGEVGRVGDEQSGEVTLNRLTDDVGQIVDVEADESLFQIELGLVAPLPGGVLSGVEGERVFHVRKLTWRSYEGQLRVSIRS